mgnify:CR=1 FL=1
MNKILSEEQIIDDAVKNTETVQDFQNYIDEIKYKEELNKEIAEAREWTNVDKYVHIDTHQLMKTDKQHIIEVLMHAMATIRFLKKSKKNYGKR